MGGVVVEIGSSISSFQKDDRVVGYGVGSYIDASGKHLRFPGTLTPVREFKVRRPGPAYLGRVIK